MYKGVRDFLQGTKDVNIVNEINGKIDGKTFHEHISYEGKCSEAAGNITRVLKEPKPYIWITKFQNYAIEYTLYVFINDIKGLPEIDAELHRTVFETCKRHKIDISTLRLLRL